MKEQNPQDAIIITKMSEPTLNPISNCQPKSNIVDAVASSSKECNLNQPSGGMILSIHAEKFIGKNVEQQEKIPTEYAGIHQVRPIRVSPPKPGKLYPCLSDIDSVTENESESDEQQSENTSQNTEYVCS